MASNTAAVPPLSELSGAIEELRRQLASANDAQLATEVGHQHQTVLSNIMLTGQEDGQVAPPEDLEKAGPGVAKAVDFSPVSNFKNGTIILHTALGQLVVLYTRYTSLHNKYVGLRQVRLLPVPQVQPIGVQNVMVEIKKYRSNF